MTKKILTVCLALLLTACGKTQTDDTALPDFTAESEITGEITVSCYNDNSFLLDNAMLMFVEKYPGVKVNVEQLESIEMRTVENEDGTLSGEGTQLDDAQTEANYIQKLNTEIMSGRGPDILQIDIIPWYKYAETGYLLDMQTLMEQDPDFNGEDYRMNVINALKYKNGLYVFPISFG